MTDSTMKDLQHGSIIKTINNANKREEWSLVLGCMEDQDTVTCLRLVLDEEFKNIPSLKVTTDVLGGDAAYANPFSFLNIKLDWIVEVKDPISQIEFFSVVSSVVNYFAGFFYKDNGELKMDMPYVQNPVFFMINGMVTINQARNLELTSKIKMAERKEKKEHEAVERKMSNIKPFGKKKVGQKTPQLKDLNKTFENLGVYTLDTQNRIEAIYKFFLNYLAPGERLSIPMVYKMMFKGAQLQRMQVSKSSVTKEEFAFIINSDPTSIADRIGISIITARTLRHQAISIANGKEEITAVKPSTNLDAAYELARELRSKGIKPKDITDTLIKDLGISVVSAKRITNYSVNRGNTGKSNDQIGKILSASSYVWVSSLKNFDKIFDEITTYSTQVEKIHDGSVVVNSGDLFDDAIILIAIYSAINSWTWFNFAFEDRYRKVVENIASMTINDMLDHYIPNKMQHQTFYSSKLIIFKIIADFICLSDEDKLLMKAIGTDAISYDPEKIDPICRAYVSVAGNSMSKSVSKAIGNIVGLPNADRLLNIAEENKIGFTQLDNADKISEVLIASRRLKK